MGNPITSLSADYAAGVKTLLVKNTAQFQTTKFAVLENLGFEQAELGTIDTITAPQTLVLDANTSFPHNADCKVTMFDYNQIKVYKSTTGVNGTYNFVSAINIDVSEDFTTYEDIGASASYYYKYSYYNSVTQAETVMSDPISATGFVFYALKTLVDRVLSLFGDAQSQFVGRDEVTDYLNEIYELAQHELAIATRRLGMETYQFTTVANQQAYALPADFLMEKAVRASQNNGQTFPYNCQMLTVDSLGTYFETNNLYGYSIVNNTIQLDPIPTNSSDVIQIYYIPMPTSLVYQTDTLASPFQNRTALFVRYALAMCYLKDKKWDEYKDLRDTATTQLADFVSYIKKLGNLHPTSVQIVNSDLT